jgi:hypothetical protein
MTEGHIPVMPSSPVRILDQPWMDGGQSDLDDIERLASADRAIAFPRGGSLGSLDYCIVNQSSACKD